MTDQRKKYLLALALMLAGAVWMSFNFRQDPAEDHTVCLFKHLSSIPCPSCGTTRAWVLLFNGDVTGAIMMNPLGILTALLFIVCFISILRDGMLGRQDFLLLWKRTEQALRRKYLYVPLTGLVLVNWCWSIAKGL